jgi:bacteriorhodopsin
MDSSNKWLKFGNNFNTLFIKQIIMMTQREKEKLIKDVANIFVLIGGLITIIWVIYFIVDTIKKWY